MASTRNKNDKGNYMAEEKGRQCQRLYSIYEYQGNGKAFTNNYAGDGLLVGKMSPCSLSYNYTEIDSYLKGIGSTNLVSPMPEIKPKLKELESLSVINRIPLVMPNPMRIVEYQRPLLS
jgi:hypothetical protein